MRKALYVAIIAVIIVSISFTALMFILRYDEKGETNMPFEVTKISVISVANAQDVKDDKNKWNKNVELDNDIFIYLDKNDEYKKTETIEKIVINNFKIVQKSKKGEISIYKPSENQNSFFENSEENKVAEITYTGEQSTDIQKLHISNQGGMIAFRIANLNLGNFTSNEIEIESKDYLKNINIQDDEIKAKISFDMTIFLNGGRKYKASEIELDVPSRDTVETGNCSTEITDLKLVFKRIEN